MKLKYRKYARTQEGLHQGWPVLYLKSPLGKVCGVCVWQRDWDGRHSRQRKQHTKPAIFRNKKRGLCIIRKAQSEA